MSQVFVADNVVAVENRSRFVAGDHHCNPLRYHHPRPPFKDIQFNLKPAILKSFQYRGFHQGRIYCDIFDEQITGPRSSGR
jgi:hypothetical protein